MEKSKISYEELIDAALNKKVKITKSTKKDTVYWRNRYTYISRLSHLLIGK